ncbi:ATP synthase subunit c [uncultured archaeon]|nr:ATP synthase subunit c [uncultured archaeon]
MVAIEIGKEFSAAVAIGLSSMAAGYAIAGTGAAAAGAVAEKPEVSGKVLLFVALAEAIAIYGLVVSLMILFQ